MTREEEIKLLVQHLAKVWYAGANSNLEALFEEAVQWADEHPKNPWRDAKKEPPKREIGNKIFYTFFDTAFDGVHEQRYYYYAEFKKYGLGKEGWIDEDGNRVLVEIADYWMPIPELKKGE